MGEIQKQTDEIRVETEEEAKALIESFKEKENTEGYELVSYTSIHKTKKSKGDIIDDYFIVKLTKVW